MCTACFPDSQVRNAARLAVLQLKLHKFVGRVQAWWLACAARYSNIVSADSGDNAAHRPSSALHAYCAERQLL